MEAENKACLACGKTLRGRVDKKFCDDYCRNSYNNQRNSDQNNLVRNINNVLRKNRRILEKLIPADEETKKIKQESLAREGFNFKYHTHQYQNKKGQVYFFNYDYGFLQLEEDWILIVKRKFKNG
jgi:hypothetical protein